MLTSVDIRWQDPRAKKPHFFLLLKEPLGKDAGSVSVDLTDVSSVPDTEWATPERGVTCLVSAANDFHASFNADDIMTSLRLRFAVTPTVKGVTGNPALSVTQRFSYAGGVLTPDRFRIEQYTKTSRHDGGDDPVEQLVPVRTPMKQYREFLGAHPLIKVVKGVVTVDTEFLDVTELWWKLHYKPVRKMAAPDQIPFHPWYLSPGGGGQSKRLSVLVNTRTAPMVWFASLPKNATTDLPNGTEVGGYVFFRPPGSSPISYSSVTASGLADPLLGTTAMATLARYLLNGRTHAQKNPVTGLPEWQHMLGYVEQVGDSKYLLNAYGALPCGMEEALDRSSVELLPAAKSVRVLLLPQLSVDIGYAAILGAGIAGRSDAAIRLLWSQDLIGGPGQQLASGVAGPQPPQSGLSGTPTGTLKLASDYWLGGYSRSGDTLWAALDLPINLPRLGRIIAFDTTGLIAAGTKSLTAAVRARGKLGLRVFLLWTPYAVGAPPTALAGTLRSLGATVTVLPEAGPDYFRVPPNPTSPWVEYIFGDNKPWADGPVGPAASAGGWWHQVIAFAGEHLANNNPQDPASITFMHATMRP